MVGGIPNIIIHQKRWVSRFSECQAHLENAREDKQIASKQVDASANPAQSYILALPKRA